MVKYTITTPLDELRSRISKLQAALSQKGVDGALIVQKTDLYYFSGTAQHGWMYIPAEGFPVVMVCKDFDRACQESALPDIVSLVSPKLIPQCLHERDIDHPAVMGMELDVLPVNMFRQLQAVFKSTQIEDVSTDIRLIRSVKSDYEIARIEKAAQLSDELAAKVGEFIAPGKTEVEVAGQLEGFARSLGHQGIVRMRMWGNELFYGHLLAGDSGGVPSYLASPTGGKGVSGAIAQGAGYRKIGKNETVVVDYVFALDGYLADHTRIFSIGPLPDKLMKAHEAILELQELVRKTAKPGAITGDIYDFMVQDAARRGYGDNFMGVGERKIRFTGHGIGLELDEFPFIAKNQKLVLEEGMVIALEPKLIFPGIGVVGIENTHVVTDRGLVSMTKHPDQITILQS